MSSVHADDDIDMNFSWAMGLSEDEEVEDDGISNTVAGGFNTNVVTSINNNLIENFKKKCTTAEGEDAEMNKDGVNNKNNKEEDSDILRKSSYDLSVLNQTHYHSKLKTCFWKLGCLIVFKIDNTLTKRQFITNTKLVLHEFTKNINDIEDTTVRVLNILHTIKAYRLYDISKPARNDIRHVINKYKHSNKINKNNSSNCTNKDFIRTVTKEQTQMAYSIVFERLMKYPPPNIVELTWCADFGLVSRLQLAVFAVVLDIGFNEFERAVKTEINSLRRSMKFTLPVYKWCNNYVLNNAIYLTNHAYMIMSDGLYSVVRDFIDKI